MQHSKLQLQMIHIVDTLGKIIMVGDDIKDKILLLDLWWEKKKFPNEEKEIRERQYNRRKLAYNKQIESLTERIKFAEQEANFFVELFKKISEIEPLKDYDDLGAQKEYWNEKFEREIHLKLILQQPLDTDLVLTALALTEDSSVRVQMEKMIEYIQEQKKLLNKVQNAKIEQ